MSSLPTNIPRFAKDHVLARSRAPHSGRHDPDAAAVPAMPGAHRMAGQPRFTTSQTQPGLFTCSLRSPFNTPLLVTAAQPSLTHCEQAMARFADLACDENCYRIQPLADAFVLVLYDPQAGEIARSRPITGEPLARATLKLSVLQARRARDHLDHLDHN